MKHTVITSPKDLKKNPSGVILVVGPCTHGSIDNDSDADNWIPQPPRPGKRGSYVAGTEPVFISLDEDVAAALKKYKSRDIRLGYDGYIRWLLKRKTDTALIAGVPYSGGTWITIISARGGVIDGISEASMPESNHAIFQSELKTLISSARVRHQDMDIVLSLPDCGLGKTFAGIDNIEDEPFAHAKGELALGYARLPRKQLMPPLMAVFASLLYAAFTVYTLSAQIENKNLEYKKAIAGIEDEYRRGSDYTRLLESQRALLTDTERTSPLTSKVRDALSSLAISENLLLVNMEVKEKNAEYETTIRFAVLPDIDVTPAAQAEPILTRLATAMDSNV